MLEEKTIVEGLKISKATAGEFILKFLKKSIVRLRPRRLRVKSTRVTSFQFYMSNRKRCLSTLVAFLGVFPQGTQESKTNSKLFNLSASLSSL